jgi:hypothetical protein
LQQIKLENFIVASVFMLGGILRASADEPVPSAPAQDAKPDVQASPTSTAGAAPEKDWYVALRLGFMPYNLDASGAIGNRPFDVSSSLSDITSKTDTTILGGDVEFGKQGFFIDVPTFYQKSVGNQGNGILGAQATLKELNINPMIGYRVFQQAFGDGQAFAVDAMAGVSYVRLSAGLTLFDPVNGNELSPERDFHFTDPMIGTRVSYAFSKKFGINASGEIGGFTLGSKLQAIAQGGVGYNVTDWFQASVGFKYWYFRYEDNTQLLNSLNQTIYGPLVGVQFKY